MNLIEWIKQNRRRLLAFAILGVAFFLGGRHLLVSSWAYKNALAVGTSSISVQRSLGEPIEPGFWVGGTVRWSGPSGSAHISIPISGPNGDGTIIGWATKKNGAWVFKSLYLQTSLHSDLDLLSIDSSNTNVMSSAPATSDGNNNKDLEDLSWAAMGMEAAMYLLFAAIIIGYPLCHAILGPILLKKSRRRALSENYTYFGSILLMESDLKEIAEQGDKNAAFVVHLITLCKWLILCGIVALVAFAVLATDQSGP